MNSRPSRAAGFTLVELIIVIVLIGALASGAMVYFKPAIESYVAVGRRASLVNQAEGALRLITIEARSSVANSLRSCGVGCIEMVPTSDGGRFRIAPDPVTPGTMAIDNGASIEEFDVLTDTLTAPQAGDWIVIGNHNGGDVYSGINRAAISATAPSAFPAGTAKRRIRLATPTQFPLGYESGRFVVVPNATQAVTYLCSNPGLDPATANGRGILYRFSAYNFNAAATMPTIVTAATATPANPATPIVATRVESCNFTFNPNQGATQQSGYLEVQLTLTEANESVSLVFGAQVNNLP